MRKYFVFIFCCISFSVIASRQLKDEKWMEKWEKMDIQQVSPETLLHVYTDNRKMLRPLSEAMILNDCYFVLRTGDYFLRRKSKTEQSRILLDALPEMSLSDSTVSAFLIKVGPALFTDAYFMLQALKNGATFDEARDGITLTTEFPARALNRYDYRKLEAIFGGANETLKAIYLEKMKYLFRNNGCTDGLMELKPLIVREVRDVPVKQEILELYARYEKLRPGQPAPLSVFRDTTEKEYCAADFAGKVIVIDVWATWCCECIERIPHFLELQQYFAADTNVVFLSLSIDSQKDKDKWQSALTKYRMTSLLNLIALPDESSFGTDYAVVSVPRHIVIDQQGNLVDAFAPDGEKLKKIVERALAIPDEQGTYFEELSFRDALEKAKAKGLPLFIDCYTKTCVPCKYMVKCIFPLKACGDYFNNRYVCIMKDMEEDDGREIARKYGIEVYPTYLILDGNGTEICRLLGGVQSPEEDFPGKVRNAVKGAELDRQYQSGVRDERFIEKYMTFLRVNNRERLLQVMDELFPSLGVKKLCEQEKWELVTSQLTHIDGPLFRYIFTHRKAFIKRLGREEVMPRLFQAYAEEFRMYKLMGLNYAARIADLQVLEKEGYTAARSLRYQLLCREIIDGKQKDRIEEIVEIVYKELPTLPAAAEQICVARELNGINVLATPEQLRKIMDALLILTRQMSPRDTAEIKRILYLLSRT